jgi:hypothetical protein
METSSERRQRIRRFLMNCSGQELTDFMLTRYAGAANLRKAFGDLIDEWIEQTADARLAAEVNAIREELKHSSTLPFPKKVEQAPPHRHASAADPALDHADQRRRYFDADGGQHPRKFSET